MLYAHSTLFYTKDLNICTCDIHRALEPISHGYRGSSARDSMERNWYGLVPVKLYLQKQATSPVTIVCQLLF
jgi:hypothetical protein